MSMEPPPFQEAPRCDVCNCSFSTFKRRHHCRSCGRTLCHEHSSNQTALPQFGIYSNVRVCADCYNNSSSAKSNPQVTAIAVDDATDSVSKLNITSNVDSKTESTALNAPAPGNIECKCGMPLCICEAPAPSIDVVPQPMKTAAPPSQPNPRPKKTDTAVKSKASSSNSKFGSIFNLGQVTNGTSDKSDADYEANGEGLREAIKNGDIIAVKRLLDEGVDANYRDRQGLSLLHLAALFNQTDIVFILMDSGANLEYRNAQGESPIDCAPATLQYRMRQKMEESGAIEQSK